MEDIEVLGRVVLGLGAESKELNSLHMGVRAVVVYVTTVFMVRLGKKRFMGQSTAFDVILGIMLGSVVGRAITGTSPFFPTITAGAVLLAMHWLFSGIAVWWPSFGAVVKGHSKIMVKDGKVDWALMRGSHMTERDLWEDLRDKGISRLEDVAEAHLEQSGKLSVIKAKAEPKVVEVRVQDGVQTVRYEPADAPREPQPRPEPVAALAGRTRPLIVPLLRVAGGLSVLAGGLLLLGAVLEGRFELLGSAVAGAGVVTGIVLLGFAENLAILHEMRRLMADHATPSPGSIREP